MLPLYFASRRRWLAASISASHRHEGAQPQLMLNADATRGEAMASAATPPLGRASSLARRRSAAEAATAPDRLTICRLALPLLATDAITAAAAGLCRRY